MRQGGGPARPAVQREAVDARNQLNELSNREWLKRTKSVWYSRPGPRDPLKQQHPATFAESDIVRLLELFTKPGQWVLDPFVGSGSTLIACLMAGRRGVGIELVERWAEVARQRVKNFIAAHRLAWADLVDPERDILVGDSRQVLRRLADDSFDFVVTSPPYWNILHKECGLKVTVERRRRALPTRYSDRHDDLGNLASYEDFLQNLMPVWQQCARVLKPEKYMAVVVSDFRHGERYYLYHADTARCIEQTGLVLKGSLVLVQDNKALYPYGIPRSFVPNVHHQMILIFQKPRRLVGASCAR
jgi:DNA modification methylase